jgi:hypothetical protein
MAFTYQVFDSLPSTLVADLKAKILLSSDYSNPSGNVVKATTPLGATIAIDLTGSGAPTVQAWQPLVWRTYATSSGTDQLPAGYTLWWKAVTSGALGTVPLHVTLYAGNTLLYVSIEGPRYNESFADGTMGSLKQSIFISQLTPYHVADTTPTVVFGGSNSFPGYSSATGAPQSIFARVGQNQAANAPWVGASLSALHFPSDMSTYTSGWTPRASDGSNYLSPYVVFEQAAGIRGRLTDLYFAGVNRSNNVADQALGAAPGEVMTIGSNSYRIEAPYRTSGNNNAVGALGAFYNAGNANGDYGRSPLVAVRAV